MNLPENFPLSEQQLTNIKERLDGVTSYQGMGVAGPIRDLNKVYKALAWCLGKWEVWKNAKTSAENQNQVLRQYMTSAEAVIAGYAAGNWDGGTAASQLLNNMPQIQ